MSEGNVIKNTKQLNTVDSLAADLKNMGIKSGDLLLVHSSLSSLGWVCGGAHAVVLSLLKVLGENGTLVMPTHSGDLSDPAEWRCPPVPEEWIPIIYETMPAFDKDITPSRGMGKIPELFRIFPNTLRSNHPQLSFAASGKLAELITNEHELTPAFGMNSPLGKLYNNNGKVLLLGAEFDSCTSFHLAEALCEDMPKSKKGTAINVDGNREWVWFHDFDYDSDDFDKIGEEFIESGKVIIGNVGNAKCYLFDIKEAVDFAKQWLLDIRFSK